MDNIEEIILELKDHFSKELGEAKELIEDVRQETKALTKDTDRLGKFAKRAFAIIGSGAIIKNVANLGIEMEQTRVSFKTFLGDADKANSLIQDLNEFSNVTPFRNDQVIKAGKSLLAFGTPLENIETDLKAIGDISAGTGKDFNELATIYGKARIAGKLYAEDINQLIEAGIPIISEFAKQLGVNESQVKKLASEGKIGFEQLETAFKSMTGEGGLFYDLMEQQSQTVGGQISTLQGQLQGVGIAIGEALLPVIQSVIEYVKVLTEWITANKDQIAAWVPIIAKLVGIIGVAIGIYKAWIGVQTLINFLLTANPIGLIITAIGALIGVISILWKDTEELSGGMRTLQKVLKFLFFPIDMLIKGIKLLSAYFRENYEAGGWVKKMADFVGGALRLLGKIVRAVGNFFSDLPTKALSAFDAIKSKIQGFVKTVKGAVQFLLHPFDEEARKAGLKEFNEGLAQQNEGFGDAYNRFYKDRKIKQREEEERINKEVNKKFGNDAASGALNGAQGSDTGLGGVTGGGFSGSGGGKGSSKKSGLSGITAQAPKSVTLTIEKLVENVNINTTNLSSGSSQIKEEITRILVSALNDAQIQAGN